MGTHTHNRSRGFYFILLTLCLTGFGGFYEYVAFASGIAGLVYLAILMVKQQIQRIHIANFILGFAGVALLALPSLFVAQNHGMAWMGWLRLVPVLVWLVMLAVTDEEVRNWLLSCVPWLGIAMVLISVASLPIPKLKQLFWMSERLGGTFQYSNTCALFLLIGLILLLQMKSTETQAYAKMSWSFRLRIPGLLILLAGILLTGSRSVVILLVGYLIYSWIRRPSTRRCSMLLLGTLIVAGVVGTIFLGATQNIGRISTILTQNSTMWGRLLYVKDGTLLSLKHPLGLGYYGYSEIQHSIQTGTYTTLFVHNDWLQIALDYGIPALILTIIVFVKEMSHIRHTAMGTFPSTRAEILVITALACLVDFHLQYFAMIMVVSLCFDFTQKGREIRIGNRFENLAIAAVISGLLFFFALPSFLHFAGNEERALYYFEGYTPAAEHMLLAAESEADATALANKVLKQNPYNADAYNVLAYSHLAQNDIDGFIHNKEMVIENQRYGIEHYKDLKEQLDRIEQSLGSSEAVTTARTWLQNQITQVIQETSPLASHLRDHVDLTQIKEVLR